MKLKELYDKWFSISDKIRFLIIGGVNAGISYVIYSIAILILGETNYQICAALQWIISSVFSFTNQKLFVFCTKGNWIKEYFRCCTTWIISYFCNAMLLELFVRFLIRNVFVAQFISMFLASIVTYVLFKYFAFKHK